MCGEQHIYNLSGGKQRQWDPWGLVASHPKPLDELWASERQGEQGLTSNDRVMLRPSAPCCTHACAPIHICAGTDIHIHNTHREKWKI